MTCSHPVLYEREGGLFCIACKAFVTQAGNNPPPPETAPEPPKKTVKRSGKKT